MGTFALLLIYSALSLGINSSQEEGGGAIAEDLTSVTTPSPTGTSASKKPSTVPSKKVDITSRDVPISGFKSLLQCIDYEDKGRPMHEEETTFTVPRHLKKNLSHHYEFSLQMIEDKDDVQKHLNCSSNHLVTVSATTLDHHGTLELQQKQWGRNIEVDRKNYCLFLSKQDGEQFKVCNTTLQQKLFKKCCPFDRILLINENKKQDREDCLKVTKGSKWYPSFYRETLKRSELPKKWEQNFTIGFPHCQSKYIINDFRKDKFANLLENGSVTIVREKPKHKYTINPGDFCIDGILLPPISTAEYQNDTEELVYSRSEWKQGIIICMDRSTVEVSVWIVPLYAAVNHTAALFLFLTSIVYVLLWSNQNIHGWLRFSYTLSLFFAFSFLAIVQVWTQQIHDYSPELCKTFGWLIHFSQLSSYSWLTSMNFDLFWRFGVLSSCGRYMRRGRIGSQQCRENIKKFVCFALFSIGLPCSITMITVMLDSYFEDEVLFGGLVQLPRFGKDKCYFQDIASQFPFLYLPAGVLLAVNLGLFSSTVVQLRKIHNNTELARSQSTLEDKKGVRLISKLFIIMGVLWVFGFISFAANMVFPQSQLLLYWLFMPTEILNSFQGVAIFVIFICKPNVLSQLSAKFGSLRCRSNKL